MNYSQTLEYLYNSAPMFQQVGSKAYKEGMDNSFAIDLRLNHPHRNYRTIHVAGTNGKGSTSHLLASILQQSGYKVGLYTSPHLVDFRERIRVNGQMISQNFVVDFVAQHLDFFKELQPSFFELTTGMAFSWFAEQKVDVAVIEVGLGGRLDCTNVITPDLSIITNISFDHTALLGNTLEAIANEKAGIIKPGIPVVIGETTPETKEVFLKRFEDVNASGTIQAQIVFAESESPIQSATLLSTGQWRFDTEEFPNLIGQLGGFAQEKNAATVLCSLKLLKQGEYTIPDIAVYEGFARVVEISGLLGRWQVVNDHPKTIFDTGHNVGGMQYIVRQLQQETYDHLHIVIGMVNDKDISSVLQLLPTGANYYFTQASVPRALDSKQLAERAAVFGLKGNAYPSVEEAYRQAKQAAQANDLIFVGGSTFIVADVLQTEK